MAVNRLPTTKAVIAAFRGVPSPKSRDDKSVLFRDVPFDISKFSAQVSFEPFDQEMQGK
jgi:hypothetical protein